MENTLKMPKEKKIRKIPYSFWTKTIFFLALIYCLLVACNSVYYDSDTYFILNTGKYLVNNGFPETNPFTIHEGLGMVVHQWLFDVIVYGAYAILGNFGLMLLSNFLLVLMYASIYSLSYQFTDKKGFAATISLVAMFPLIGFMALRPTFLSLSLFFFSQAALWKYKHTGRKAWLSVPIVLSFVIVNVHTSLWIMDIVMMLPFVAPVSFNLDSLKEWFRSYFNKSFVYWVVLLLSVIAGFGNPYGIKGMLYPLLSYGTVTDLGISELQKPAVLSLNGAIIIVALILVTAIAFIRKLDFSDDFCHLLYTVLGTTFLAMMHYRNIWFVFIGLIPIVVSFVQENVISHIKKRPKESRRKIRIIEKISGKLSEFDKKIINVIAKVLLTFICIMIVASCFSSLKVDTKAADWLTPEGAADYLDEYDTESIVLYTGFNHGAYMQLRGYKTYIDARPELYTKKMNGTTDVISEYEDLESGQLDYGEFLDKYDFTHLVVDNCYLKVYLESSDEYECVWSDEESNLYLYESITFQKG